MNRVVFYTMNGKTEEVIDNSGMISSCLEELKLSYQVTFQKEKHE